MDQLLEKHSLLKLTQEEIENLKLISPALAQAPCPSNSRLQVTFLDPAQLISQNSLVPGPCPGIASKQTLSFAIFYFIDLCQSPLGCLRFAGGLHSDLS